MAASKGTLSRTLHSQGLSGLKGWRRIRARRLARRAAMGGVKVAPEIHYSQAANRWYGIANKCNPFKGEYPHYADCSAYTTWVLWAVLVHHFGFHADIVNGANWDGGYTGTQIRHGKQIKLKVNWRVGDLIFYGDQGGGVPEHVAMYVGAGMVVSHGSEAAPFHLPWNYRTDLNQVRRYI